MDVIYVSLAIVTTNPVTNLTLDGYSNEAYFDDVLNYGSYLAFKEGFEACKSVGKKGPRYNSLTSGFAPWTIVVGSTTSRGRFITHVELRNGMKLNVCFNSTLQKHVIIFNYALTNI